MYMGKLAGGAVTVKRVSLRLANDPDCSSSVQGSKLVSDWRACGHRFTINYD